MLGESVIPRVEHFIDCFAHKHLLTLLWGRLLCCKVGTLGQFWSSPAVSAGDWLGLSGAKSMELEAEGCRTCRAWSLKLRAKRQMGPGTRLSQTTVNLRFTFWVNAFGPNSMRTSWAYQLYPLKLATGPLAQLGDSGIDLGFFNQ